MFGWTTRLLDKLYYQKTITQHVKHDASLMLNILQTSLTSACIFAVASLLLLSHPPLWLHHPVSLHFQCWWIKLELENLKIIDENRVTRGYLQHL